MAARRRSDTALQHDAKALYDAMTELLRVYQFRDRDRLGYGRLTITEMYVVDCLWRRGSLTLNALTAAMYLDKSTLSRVVDSLEGKRFVARRQNPGDGRSVLLTATASGIKARRAVEKRILPENAKLLADVPAATRRQLIGVIDAMSAAAAARTLDVVNDAAS